MAIHPELLKILVCPEDKTPVTLAPAELITELNDKVAEGSLKNRAGEPVTERFEAGLIREDRRYLYPIREDIPVMLIDEAIPL